MWAPFISLTGSDIVESNPGKFRLGESELKERKDFVERTRKSVQVKLSLITYRICCFLLFPGCVLSFLCVCVSSYGGLSGLFQWFEDIYSGGTGGQAKQLILLLQQSNRSILRGGVFIG